ncbi:MAG: glycosyl hydrolase 53 family protein [Anaerolineae bacterium]|nr:glycosyl hydrolase 53 family protein [Anaerolineae bacterium]
MITRRFLFLVLILGFLAVPARVTARPASRSYYLGFTPFPYDISFDAVNFTYDKIATDADLISHAFDNGVPWPEALSGKEFHANVMGDWNLRKTKTPTDHKVYVQITPINLMRNALAPYRAEKDDLPLPVPWDSYAFNAPEVKQSYLNYCRRVIAYFDPDFLAIGIEVNLLMQNRPDLWPSYVELHRYVYGELKKEYPTLPIMVTFQVTAMLEGYQPEYDHQRQMQALRDLIDYTDIFAMSVYPYFSVYTTQRLPTDIFDQLAALTDKPLAVSETGYPAQPFTLTQPPVTFETDETKQNRYISLLLAKANEYNFKFIINFVLRDYDRIWELTGKSDFVAVWRDTGLYDENGKPRQALQTWKDALALPVR